MLIASVSLHTCSCLRPRGRSGLKCYVPVYMCANTGLRPRGRSGLKSLVGYLASLRRRLRPRGRSGLKYDDTANLSYACLSPSSRAEWVEMVRNLYPVRCVTVSVLAGGVG